MPQWPAHIAIIPDGNGRWASDSHQLRSTGHKRGADRLREVIEYTLNFPDIKALTVFGFSTENRKRPKTEIRLIMSIIRSELKKISGELHEKNIRLQFIGDRTHYPKGLLHDIETIETNTKTHTGLVLTIALHYSGRWDIMQAMKRQAEAIEAGSMKASDICLERASDYLQINDLPDPDLLIRTSGEQRVSNFCLWQLAYTELYFTPCYWPDFNTHEFDQAIEYYQSRQRRFGNVTDERDPS